jgi:HSP20 family molecular chaperone IbpA
MQARVNALLSGVASKHALPSGAYFSPPADLVETDHFFVICLELAGVDAEDFEVIVRDRNVFIRGKRLVKIPPEARVHQMEIDFGEFRKIIELTCPVVEDGIKSRYEKGMLVIELPKHESCRIDVNAE